MRIFKFSFFCVVLVATFALGTGDLWAQRNTSTKLPDISVPPLGMEGEQSGRLNPESFTEFEIQNNYFGDKIKLQYQLALLEKMIAFQKQLNEVKDAYSELGITYKSPKPVRSICLQIPVNVPCFDAYPELYPGLNDSLEARKQEMLDSAIEDLTGKDRAFDAILNAARPEQVGAPDDVELAKTEAKKKPEVVTSDYQWVEIFCLSGECQGVLTKSGDDDFRTTVRIGDELPDGSKVSKLQASRMEVTKSGTVIALRPAPLAGGSGSSFGAPTSGTNALADAFTNSIGGGNGGERRSTSLDDLPTLMPVVTQTDIPATPAAPAAEATGLNETGLIPN